MTASPDFFAGHLPYWIINFGLAIIGWTAIGRLLLGLYVPPESTNYIWRFFRLLTDRPLLMVAWTIPRMVLVGLHPAFLAFWCFVLRWVLVFAMAAMGMTPHLSPFAAPH